MAIRKPIFVEPVTFAYNAMVCSSAEDGHPAAHLLRHKQPGLTWRSAYGSSHWLLGWFDSEQQIDFLSIVAASALPGTKIRLRLGTSQAEVEGTAPYDSGVMDFISPAIVRADGLYHSHHELPAAQTCTWFRIDITGHTGVFEAAALVIGNKVEPSHFYNWDMEFGIEDLGSGEFTQHGVFDEQDGMILRTIDFTLGWQTQAEFESTFRPMMERLGTRGTVYLCFDPEPGPNRQAKTYLGVFRKAPFARGTRRPGFTQDISLISVI